MNPKVSIIVPVYNTEKYLRKCLDSIINQTLKDIEIIIINDNSIDNSISIIKKYTNTYSNISFINLDSNKGPGGARNEGIKIATGEYISFVDSDDDIEANMLEELYLTSQKTNCDVVDCGFYYEALNQNFLTTTKETTGILDINKRKELILHSGFIWSKLYKRSLLIDNNILFRSNVAYEDIDFLREVFLYCKSIDNTDKILYNHRINKESITQFNDDNIKINHKILSMKALVHNFKKASLYNDYIDEITYLIYKTYMVLLDYCINLEVYIHNINIFKELHDFFKELVNYDYHNNKYILEIDESEKAFAEINNIDYRKIIDVLK